MRCHMLETHEEHKEHGGGPKALWHHLHTKKGKVKELSECVEGQCEKEAKLQQGLVLILIHNSLA